MNVRSAPAHAYTCHSVATVLNSDWLSSREIRVKVEIFQLERICRGTNPCERARLCTALCILASLPRPHFCLLRAHLLMDLLVSVCAVLGSNFTPTTG